MKQNKGNLIWVSLIIVLNILFYATGGMLSAIEVSPAFGAAMGTLLLAPLIGMLYLTIEEWRK